MSTRPATDPHLLLALSAHGYGHLAQCAPVVNALVRALPELRLTVCGGLPEALVRARIHAAFSYHTVELDPVLQMHSAWEVDAPGSRRVYRAFHEDWETGLQRDRALLRDMAPDLVLADIPYRIVLAAAQQGVGTVCLCSLDWASIYSAYAGDDPRDRGIVEQILACYRAADVFLTPQPAMPMPALDNTHAIGPIARRGRAQPGALRAACACTPAARVVLVALGGIETAMPLADWPRVEGTVWVFAHAVQSARVDMIDLDDLPMPFIDVLASSDAVLTKPGYGTYAEAVCHGVAILTLQRPDWPETTALNSWAAHHGRLAQISRKQFLTGDFMIELERLLQQPPGRPVAPDGTATACRLLQQRLTQSSPA